MAISSSSSSSSSDNKVQNCSKQCLESFKTLQKNFDSEREKHNRAKLEIQGYELALESLESRILGHEKNEMAWGEKYEFQNYDLKCREIKINNLKTELEKVVKERDELKVKIEKWEESSKSLNKLLNSQMNANDKNGLGYGTQMDEMSNKFETDSEISMSIFEVRSCDEEITSANDRFYKADGYHVVPPPITGNILTPRANISFAGNTNEVNIEKPKSVYELVVSTPNINREKVIIEDWTSDDEEEVPGVQKVRPETRDDKSGQNSHKQGVGFRKVKACFVCKRRANQYGIIPKSTARPVSTTRPSINTTRPVSTASLSISIARPGYASRPIYPRMDNVRPRSSCSPIKRSYYTKPAFRPKDLKQDVKTFGVKNMTTAGKRVVVNTESRSFMLKEVEYVDPKGISKSVMAWIPKGFPVVDSGCSSHMTGNKAYLSDYEDYNEGFMAFGSDPKGVKDVVQIAQEKPSENASSDKDVQDSEDATDKEEQHHMQDNEKDLQDELEMLVTQELVAKAIEDVSRQAFKEEKRRIASQKKATQATSTNQLSTDRLFVSTDRSFVSTDRSNTPNVSAASTSIGANADASSFVYLGGNILIIAYTLPNADLPIDPNMPALEDASDTLPNDGIFNGA
ncbi:hypothetical protein Tco_1302415 [Tanacetum coccineum]